MKFMLTEEQRSIQRAVNEFTKGEFDEDTILDLLQTGQFPEKIWRKACRLGFVGLCYPEKYGGQACGLMDQVLVTEALCRKDSSAGIALTLVDMGADLISTLGTEEQKKTYLPKLAKGKLMSTVLFADVDHNDACSADHMTLSADGDNFRLNGYAGHVFNADRSELLVVQCCAPNGVCFAAVEKSTQGVQIKPLGGKLGLAMLSWQQVCFQDAIVSANAVVPIDSKEVLESLQQQHVLRICAMYLGIAQGAYEQALAYSKQRVQFRRKIAEFQGIRHKLVDMYGAVTAARSLVYNSGVLLDAQQIDPADLIMVKLQAEKSALDVTYEALQIFGGTGYMIEIPIEHYYRDARMLQGLTGRSLFQKDQVAQGIVGRLKN